MNRLARAAVRLLVGAGLLGGLVILLPAGPAHPTCARAAGEHHVALVVEHGSGRVLSACVSFTGDAITGEQILNASGIEWAASDYGSLGKAICQVDYEPGTYPSNCLQAGQPYWATFIARGGGAWSPTPYGVSRQTYVDGDAAGLRYDPQTGSPAPPPRAGPCPAAVPTAVPANPAPPAAGAPIPAAAPAANGPAPDQPAAATAPPPGASGPSGEAATPSTEPGGPTLPRQQSGLAAESAPAGRTGPAGVDLRWLLASAAFGGLGGLLAVRLALRRRQ